MTTAIAAAGLAVSCGALAVAVMSAAFTRRQVALVERQRERDFEATVVAELVRFEQADDTLFYEVCITNAGPAVARDVDVSIVEWNDESSFGSVIDRRDVAPALLRGHQRIVRLKLPRERARFEDKSRSIELAADYYDDNGVRNVRLAYVFDGQLVLTPPQPPYSSGRRLSYPRGS